MATKGRPKHNGIHKVIYYTPKPENALKAQQRVIEERLKRGYLELFKLAHDRDANQRDMQKVNLLIRKALELI